MEGIQEIVEVAVRLAAVVLPIIGITGGVKGLLGRLPTINLRVWRVRPGIYVSWGVALPLTVLAYFNGWLPPLETFESAELAVAAYWAFLAASANIVRNAIAA